VNARQDPIDLRVLRFGVEIETVRRTRQQVAEAVQSVVGGTVRHAGAPACYDPWVVTDARGREWHVVADAALVDVPMSQRAEVVTPVLVYADVPDLQEVVRAVRRCGARASAHCGIHVHVGAERFDARGLTSLARIVFKQEDLIFAALGVSEGRRDRYCRPMDERFAEGVAQRPAGSPERLKRLWYGGRTGDERQHYSPTRCRGLNLHSVWFRGTVELRYFNGTLHAGQVKTCVQFALALCAKALNTPNARWRKRRVGTSSKYDFRVFLLHLGLIGDEFKTARKFLLERLAGSAAWKNGRPPRTKEEEKQRAETDPAPQSTEGGAP
jgi:hypothetical protein